MKLLLDENITPKASDFFKSLGYDVHSIRSLGLFGLPDFAVFELAQREGRVLITHNGKDFIVQIPPLMSGIKHEGLLWLQYEINRRNVNVVCEEIHLFITRVKSIVDSIWVYKGNSNFRLKYCP